MMTDCNTPKRLEDCTYKNTSKFSYAGKIIKAKCVKVYDGDTITVAFGVREKYCRFNIRMDGYDSPEIRSKNKNESEKKEEELWARKSRDFLSNIILNKVIMLRCGDFDKYGRILANVAYGGKDINTLMISDGYCRPYDGGHKCAWDYSKFQ